jgi:hypothetical protein
VHGRTPAAVVLSVMADVIRFCVKLLVLSVMADLIPLLANDVVTAAYVSESSLRDYG